MHFYQDVFCLNNLDEEAQFLARTRVSGGRMARLYCSANTGDGDEQRALQMHLTGTYTKDTQIYLPANHRQILRQRAPERMDIEPDHPQTMDLEDQEQEDHLLRMVEQLRQRETAVREATEARQRAWEEKDRSREKARRL